MADILIVDDSPDIRLFLTFALEDAGHMVRQAEDGEQGLQEIERQAPDLMLLDMMMPNLDGVGLLKARKSRALAPETRVIVLTCKAAERDFARGWENGADAYMTKPFGNENLMETVNRVLRTSTADLAAQRSAEIEKAELLDRIESMFNRQSAKGAV